MKFLGSFPVAGERDAKARRRAATKAWREANAWVETLRTQVRSDA